MCVEMTDLETFLRYHFAKKIYDCSSGISYLLK